MQLTVEVEVKCSVANRYLLNVILQPNYNNVQIEMEKTEKAIATNFLMHFRKLQRCGKVFVSEKCES